MSPFTQSEKNEVRLMIIDHYTETVLPLHNQNIAELKNVTSSVDKAKGMWIMALFVSPIISAGVFFILNHFLSK